MKGLYIHIPFCKYICTYCDFCKKFSTLFSINEYLTYLEKEIDMYDIAEINSIYIGGGTPSCLDYNQLKKLLMIVDKYNNNDIIEYTIEMNPDDIDKNKLELLKKYRVTRLSIGVQSLNDEILNKINRKYTKQIIINGYQLANKYFDNISMDFMFNLPDQTAKDIDDVFQFISENKIKHFSFYSLIIEENTVINNQNYYGLNEDQESIVYQSIQSKAESCGYKQYEISNFAFEGYQSIHNIHYWKLNNYYGFGLGSSGYLNKLRYTNTRSLKKYYQFIDNNSKPIIDSEDINADESNREKIIFSLRMNEFTKVDKELLKKIEDDMYYSQKIIINDQMIKINPKYYFISNEIILRLLEG